MSAVYVTILLKLNSINFWQCRFSKALHARYRMLLLTLFIGDYYECLIKVSELILFNCSTQNL